MSGASRDARVMWGPLTAGLTAPHDLDLADRAKALNQLDVGPAESSRFVTVLQDVLGSGKETSLLVSARPWPLAPAGPAGPAYEDHRRGPGR